MALFSWTIYYMNRTMHFIAVGCDIHNQEALFLSQLVTQFWIAGCASFNGTCQKLNPGLCVHDPTIRPSRGSCSNTTSTKFVWWSILEIQLHYKEIRVNGVMCTWPNFNNWLHGSRQYGGWLKTNNYRICSVGKHKVQVYTNIHPKTFCFQVMISE